MSGGAADEREHCDERDAARRHQPRERGRVVGEGRWRDEHRQRARGVLDGEVAVRHLVLLHDRVAVALVDGQVGETAAVEEAEMEKPERCDERNDGNGDESPGRQNRAAAPE